MKSLRPVAPLAALLLIAPLTSGCFSMSRMFDVQAEGSFRETLPVEGPQDLEVHSGSGNITVVGVESEEIEIVARVRVWSGSVESAEALVREIEDEPPIDQVGDRIVVGRFDNERRFNRLSISYDIRVPHSTSVRVQTGSGGADVVGLVGEVDVRTGSGRLNVNDIEGDVRAQTGSGGIDAERIAGSFNGRTGSGGITFSQTAAGEVDVNTGSGGIRMSGVSGPLRARAGSGGIRVEGDPADTWYLTTGSGTVTLTVPQDAGFDLDADSSSGRVDVQSPLDFDGTSDDRRRRLRGTVGEGGPSVEIRSGSGGIRIGT